MVSSWRPEVLAHSVSVVLAGRVPIGAVRLSGRVDGTGLFYFGTARDMVINLQGLKVRLFLPGPTHR